MRKILTIILAIIGIGISATAQRSAERPFTDDICGVWVSDLAYDQATPYLALEIITDHQEHYLARILPYCILAKDYGMYTGKPFDYAPKLNANMSNFMKTFSNDSVFADHYLGRAFFAYSYVDSVYQDTTELAFFYFTNSKYIGGLNATMAHSLIDATSTLVTNITNIYGSGAGAWAGLGGAIAMGLISMSTGQSNTDTGLYLNMQRRFPGCIDVNLKNNTFVKTSDTEGYNVEKSDSTQFHLYKLYPEDKIFFAADGNELFGDTTYTENEIRRLPEYKQLQDWNIEFGKPKKYRNTSGESLFSATGNAMRSSSENKQSISANSGREYFNQQAYKKLSGIINEYCLAQAQTDPVFDQWADDLQQFFENGIQGLSYRTFVRTNAVIEGWTDRYNFIKQGVITWHSGNIYKGEFINNLRSNGTLTVIDSVTHAVLNEYTGTFKNNQRDGKGTIIFRDQTNGAVTAEYTGTFKNNYRDGAGTITFRDKTTGVVTEEYTGSFKNNYYHGQGTLIVKDKTNSAVTQVYTGSFKNGYYHGKGIIKRTGVYTLDGTFKNGHFVNGSITYPNGDIYKGQGTYNKDLQLTVREGKGTMTYANGETVTGKWINNELITKK